MSQPAIALIHGLGCTRHAWGPVLPLLAARGLRAQTVELPGYGKQSRRAPARTISGMAEAAERSVAELGDDVVVVGHSMGGLVATALAETGPSWLRRIVLVNSSLSVESRTTAHRGSEKLVRRPIVGRLAWLVAPRAKLRAGLRSAFAPGFTVPDVFVDDLRACSWATFTRSTAAIDLYLGERSLPERLADLAVPSTLIFGLRDQRLCHDALTALCEERPGSVVRIAESGHTPMWETPAQAADAIAAAVGQAAPH